MNKYPFVVAELLSTENDTVSAYFLGLISAAKIMDIETETIPDESEYNDEDTLSKFSNSQELKASQENEMTPELPPPFSKFIKFLDKSIPVNSTCAGYFAKVLKTLFFFKPEISGRLVFHEHFNTFKNITEHLYSDSLQENLLSFLKLEPGYFKHNPKDTFLEYRKELVNKVIDIVFRKAKTPLDESMAMDARSNAAAILVSLINQKAIVKDGDEIINLVLSEKNMARFFLSLDDADFIAPLTNIIMHICDYITETRAPKKTLALLDLTNYTSTKPPPEI
eukprot:CAMPEP_0114595978 /NCGR_PEP_ID=MMETSP0125-20121206/17919_1 /TAXON_ID=485358 ORGANISM="Aristerostoma sp., Strain ATCC 50986" /NCGR_SAMPLE_ID=MMETSP0125 /ASSEMBLY_ACC=CAM_ASM_000245 /LENGTH=279 /DNA_ID=CAMNT_0001798391 /DNA_START=248 /DNA_END=1087 /DNA_ORIENTATION=+